MNMAPRDELRADNHRKTPYHQVKHHIWTFLNGYSISFLLSSKRKSLFRHRLSPRWGIAPGLIKYRGELDGQAIHGIGLPTFSTKTSIGINQWSAIWQVNPWPGPMEEAQLGDYLHRPTRSFFFTIFRS